MVQTSVKDLLNTVQTVKLLKETLQEHDRLFGILFEKLDAIEQRLTAIETSAE